MDEKTFTTKKMRFNSFAFVALLIGVLFLSSNKSFGEGTKEFLVNTSLQFDTTKSYYNASKEPTTPANCVQIWDNGASGGPLGRISGTLSSIKYDLYRIKVRVCKAGEVINLGFHPLLGETTYWRLYKPDGTPIRFNGTGGGVTNLAAIAGVETSSAPIAGSGSLGPTDYSYKMPNSTAQPGYIHWYSQAAVGPSPATATVAAGGLGFGYAAGTYTGYTPIQYVVQPGDIGPSGYADFFIVFNSNQATPEDRTKHQMSMLDVTVWDAMVASPTQPTVRKGRLYCAAWDIQCGGLNNPQQAFNSKLYFYSTDSVVTSVTFNQMRPYGFVISANQYGCSNTGNTDFDRRSRVNFNSDPQYPIFLNNPYPATAADRTCGIVPKSSFGNLISATVTGCDNDRCINIKVDKTGTVGIALLPPPGNSSFVPRIFNNQTIPANTNTCVPWDGKDGAGNQVLGTTTLQINYFNGLTNLPLYDVEEHQFGYSIALVAPNPSAIVPPGGVLKNILVYWDDRAPASTGVSDFTAGAALDGYWDHDNNPLTAPKRVGYTSGEEQPPLVADTVNQSHSTYNLTGCDPTLDHNNAAGNQGVGCHLWTNRGQNGTCPMINATTNCAETHNTWWNANVIEVPITYNPSNVHVYSDQDAAPAPVGTGNTAAKTKSVCSTQNPIAINGVIKVDLSITDLTDANNLADDVNGPGKWSLIPGFASGSFGSAVSNLSNTYFPGAADYIRGYALLKITSDSTTSTPCGTANDTLRINLFQGPDVWTRPGPVNVCANNATVQLDPGVVGDSSGVNAVVKTYIWTPYIGTTVQTGGTFVSSNQALGSIATYTPPATFTSGTIIMRLKSVTTTLPAGVTCPADSSQFNIVVNTVPLVNALDTLKICQAASGTTTIPVPAGQATINGGTTTTGFSITWTGAGTFTNATTLTPTYTPTASELSTGVAKIVFKVTKTSAPSCGPVSDTLIIGIKTRPTANAGSGFTICKNNAATIPLKGVATNFGSVSWSASPATGSFSPTNNDTTVFSPSGALPASYVFTLTSNAVTGSPCPAATSTVTVTFTNPDTVDLPTTADYCPENPIVSLTVSPSGKTGEWFGDKKGLTKPLGTFSPNDKSPNVTYTLSNAELGFPIGLYYIGTPIGNCKSSVDSILLQEATKPTINLAATQSACQNVTTVNLTSSITGAYNASTVHWSTLGTGGTFNNVNSLTPVYTPSGSDKGNGSVKLVLSVQGVSNCAAVTDTIVLSFSSAPTVDAGATRSVCSNNASTAIAGTVTPAGAGHNWSYVSGPTGNFAVAGNLNTTFTATGTPTVGDTTRIRLTATLAGCNSVAADAFIVYTAPPTAAITTATGTSVCANNSIIKLKGNSSTGTGKWVSSSKCSTCFTDAGRVGLAPAVDSTFYTPSATDISNGSVTFTIQTNSSNCDTVSSNSITVNITKAPTFTISASSTCEDNPSIALSVNSANPSTLTGNWTSSSGCVSCFTLNGPTNQTGTYIPSVNDIANGTVSFTFSSVVANCVAVQANTSATINRAPTVTAGPDLTVCSTQNTVALTGASSTNTTGGVAWSIKSGNGTITNATSLTGAIYNITATDKANGTVIVVLTGNSSTGCSPVKQERVILFTDIPTASVGPDQTICQNDANPAILDGSGSNGGTWTCVGCAASIVNANSLTAQYTPAAADINQTRSFTYSIPASAGCPAVSASKNIHFNPAPLVTITAPATQCGNSMTIALTGTFTNSTGLIWTSNGTGSFNNATSTTPTYTFSSHDTLGTNSTVKFTLISTGSAPCSPDSATATVTISDPITLYAGADQNKCGTAGTIVSLAPATLSGGATSVTWSIVGASTGTLTSTGATTAQYSVGAGDAGTTVVFKGTTNAVAPCAAQTDQVSYSFIAPVTTSITGPPAGFCQSGSVMLTGNIVGTNGGTWTCTNCSGTGTFSPDNTYNNLSGQTSVSFTPSASDTSKASLTFLLTSDALNICGVQPSTPVNVSIEKKVTIKSLPDKVLCANKNVVSLPTTASIISPSGTGVWHVGATKMTGFSPSAAFPSATTYDPDTTEVQTGFVTLTLISTGSTYCPSDSTKFRVTFSEAPVANAGLDRTICKNNPTFNLTGSINPSSGFTASWSSPNCGTTCFSSPTSLTTNYTLKYPTDTLTSSLMLFMTAVDPTGLCAPDKDTVLINFTEPPAVKITSSFPNPICMDSLYVNLTGTSSGGYNWTSTGTGTFQANAFQPSVVYPFTLADRNKAKLASPNNKIRIYLSSDNGMCKPVKDSVDITLTPSPVVTITTGDSATICANLNTINLSASVDQAGFNIDWTTSGNGSFSPDAPTVPAFNTTYTLTTLDKAAGSIVLTAHTTNPVGSTCRSALKQYKVNITPLPVINPGAPYTVCQTVTSLSLADASVSNAGSATWTTNGTGVFGPNNTTVGTGSVYYPSYLGAAGSNDVDKPSITLTLTAVGCSTMTATRTINFTPKPTAAAGTDQTVCNETSTVSVSGTSTNPNGVSWKVSGSATTFANTSNTTYTLTATDKAAGFVNLVYTVNGMGSCSPATDTVKINIRPQPTIEIGPGASFCASTPSENLQYNFPAITITGGITPTWTTTGAGTLDQFNPLQPTYYLNATDINNGSVTIRATTRSNASCMIVSDATTINISKAPTLDLGSDIFICDVPGNTVQLNSTFTNNTGNPSWSSSNAGIFDDPNAVSPIYTPAPAPTENVAGNVTVITAVIGGGGACASVTDSVKIHFQGSPTLPALPDTVICYTAGVPFNYKISTGIDGAWTSTDGSATFSPSATGQQVTYNATTTPGTQTITFDPTDNTCYGAQTASGTIKLVEAPKITVTPTDACVNNIATPVSISSTPTNNGTIQWTTIQGFGNIGSANTANPTYTLKSDSSDFGLDSILLRVTVQGTDPKCPVVIDTVAIRTHQAPVLSVTNQTVCSDLLNDPNAITLNGNVSGTGYTGIMWSSAQLSSITSPTSMITTATLSAFPATVQLQATGLHASCANVTTTLTINSQAAPTFTSPGADFNGCSNGNSVNLDNANVSPSVPGGVWTKRTATAGGSFTPNNIGATGVSYNPSSADLSLGNIDLIYTITDTGVCYKGYADTVNITFKKPITITAAPNTGTFCAQGSNIAVGADSSSASPAGSTLVWSAPTGLGTFTATNTLHTFYNPNPTNVPNGGDVANGGVILMVKLTLPATYGCPNDSDFVSLHLVPEPAAIVNAGSTLRICKDRSSVQLQGVVLNADGGTWRTTKHSGSTPAGVQAAGSFSDSLDLESKYYVSSADTSKASVRLYLYSRGGNALCGIVVDSVDIIFDQLPKPTVTVGAPSVCADVDSINLTGAFNLPGVNGIWSSSGDGYFTNLGAYDATPVYIPGPSDIAAGKVIYTYSSNNYLDCKAYSDTGVTIITPKIQANAGPNLTVCGNNTTGITLTATSPPTNTGTWKPLGIYNKDYDGTFSHVANSLQATYVPGDSLDPINAAVAFRFVSSGGLPCKADSSQMVLKIAPAPTVTIATTTRTVCNDVSSINVNVTSLTIATGGYWVSSGTGSFANATALNTTYNFSSSDLADSTHLSISFITTGNTSSGSLCNAAGASMDITLKAKPVVTVTPQYNCITPIGVTLDNSSVTYADPGASGVWSTNSTGTKGQFSLDQFITSPGATATSYFPSASDINNGTVTLTLTSSGAGTCNPVSRSVTLNVSTTPIADAGKDLYVCTGSNVSLKATPYTNLVQYDWADVPAPGSLTIPSGLETTAGPINTVKNIQLTVTDSRGCTNKDTLVVSPVADPMITQVQEQCYNFYGYVHLNVTSPPISPLGGFQWYYSSDGTTTPVLMSGETRDSVRITQPGVYQVSYSLGACTRPSQNSTKVLDLPRILTPDYIGCKNSTVTATVNEIPNTQLSSLGLMPYTYNWTPGSASTTNVATLATSTVNPLVVDTISYGVTSSYTTSPFGLTCTYTDTVRVISIPVPQPKLVDSVQVCEGQTITFDANTPPSNLPSLSAFTQVIEWFAKGTTTPILDNDAVYSPTASGDYVVKVTIGQCVGGDTARADFRQYPVKTLASEIKQCFEQAGSVTLDAGPAPTGLTNFTGTTYQWTSGPGDPALNTSTSETTEITYPMIRDQDDEMIVAYVTITNHFNTLTCPVEDTVTVKDVCVPRVYPPTMFHPGDNNPVDGEFTIKGKYISHYKITVYSRWGEVIFYSEDPNKHWDGTYRGELMPVGVYAYIITYEGKDDQTKGPFKKEGRIVLVR
ncbi:MAG TPA: gliding motility-associated C-terminal domain-containing protein [Cytophagaceae bacterium]|nr:gliding motility-associated C-terminal domain-containing protein [Cytophagaceae bacterium]